MARAQLITFYSFKGGVGRTMALANAAVQLANKHGHDVIAVDWDLEAPGLHYYFDYSDEDLAQQRGLLDYLEDFRAEVAKGAAGREPELTDYLLDMKPAIAAKIRFGRVRLLACGRTDRRYMSRVQGFDWHKFYEKDKGFEIVETLKLRLRENEKISLIDARAGQGDVGATPTLQVPDAIVLLFTTNRQNLHGMADMARRLYHNADRKEMGLPPIRLVVVPSRVFATGEPYERWLKERAEPVYRELLKEGVVKPEDQREGLRECHLPVDPDYAFDESLPMLEPEGAEGSLWHSYASLSEALDDLFLDLPVWSRQMARKGAAKDGEPRSRNLAEELNRAEQRDDRHQQAGLNLSLGIEALDRNELDEAERRLQDANAYFEEKGETSKHSVSLFYLGRVRLDQGRLDEAWDLFERALALMERAGDGRGQGVTLHAMGRVRRDQGRLDEAWDLFERALVILGQAGDIREQGLTLHGMGRVRRDQGRLDEAWDLFERALVFKEQAGDIREQGVTLNDMGRVRLDQGRLDEAWDLFERAHSLAEQAGDGLGQGVTLSSMGRVRLLQGRAGDAEALLHRALRLAQDSGNKAGEAFATIRRAAAALARGDRAAAARFLEQGLALQDAVISASERKGFDQEVAEVRAGLAAIKDSAPVADVVPPLRAQ